MDNVANVTPIVPVMYTQSRQTKLGLAVVTIKQVEDLFEATVTISHGEGEKQVIFKAEGIFSSAREAFHWAYGVKQDTNDSWAGWTEENGILIETKPKKNAAARKTSVIDALKLSISSYENFELAKSSIPGDKISMSAIKASTLLSVEDKATMDRLFAKMGKVTQ